MLRFNTGISTGGYGSWPSSSPLRSSAKESSTYLLIRQREQQDHRRWLWRYFAWRIEEFPEEWPLLAGEVLNQLNSAVDHLGWQLAFLKSRPKPDRPGVRRDFSQTKTNPPSPSIRPPQCTS